MFGTWASTTNNNTAANPTQPAAGGFGTTNAFGQPAQNTGELAALLVDASFQRTYILYLH